MSTLPSRPSLEYLRHRAKDLLRAAEAGTATLENWTMSGAQLAIAREYGFANWPRLRFEVERRAVLDSRDPTRLADRGRPAGASTSRAPRPPAVGGAPAGPRR